MKHPRILNLAVALASLASATFFTGCAKDSSDDYSFQSYLDSCSALPANQQSSFMAPLPSVPVKIIVDRKLDDSTSSAPYTLNAVARAVQEWNSFGQTITKGDFFSYEVQDIPSDITSATSIDCSNMSLGDASTFYMVEVTDQTQWTSLGFTQNIPGATVRCYTNGAITQQVILVNPTLVTQDQFPVVLTHELGHSIGLDHSCSSGAGSAQYVACAGLADDDPYRTAVMYPEITTAVASSPDGSSNPTPILQANDKLRASCFYQPGQ